MLQIGGERGYGWGRVRVEGEPAPTSMFFPHYELVCTEERPQLKALNGTGLLAHIQAREDDQPRGVLDPLLGRITTNKGFGQEHSKPEICWVPGGKVEEGEIFQIVEKGIWKPLGKQVPTES